uniref:Uncharacterized protein n=1 Tax=Anguilla anguilla TaxID=7936 RepID=A0A0E9TXT4_ANGAN
MMFVRDESVLGK